MRTGEIVGEAWVLAASARLEIALYIVILTVLGAATDIMAPESGLSAGHSIVSLALGFAVVVAMIRRGGLASDTSRGFGTYFSVAILSTLGILAGVVALIIPGLILAVRWSAAYGYVLAEGEGVTASLGRSWDDTREHFWSILGAILPPVALMVPVILLVVVTMDEAGGNPEWVTVVLNLTGAVFGAASLAIGVGAYARIRTTGASEAEVFA